MFEDLFVDPRTIANLWSAPLLEERLRYLRHCAQSGARPSTLRRIAAAQTSLVRLLDLREAERVGMPRIEAVARHWAQRGGCRLLDHCVRPETRRCFVGHALRWLRFAGLLEEACKVRHAHADEVAVFGAWMRKERGCSEETISGCQSTVDRFFDWLDEWGIVLDSVGIADIDRAVARWHARGCSRRTVRGYAQRLRTFFRFAESRGWCAPGLADGIMPVRFHPGETVPKGSTGTRCCVCSQPPRATGRPMCATAPS